MSNQAEIKTIIKRFATLTPEHEVWSMGLWTGPGEVAKIGITDIKMMTGVFPAHNLPYRSYTTIAEIGIDVEGYWKRLVDLEIPADQERAFYQELQASYSEGFSRQREIYRNIRSQVQDKTRASVNDFIEQGSALMALKADRPFRGSPIATILMGPPDGYPNETYFLLSGLFGFSPRRALEEIKFGVNAGLYKLYKSRNLIN